VQTLQPSEVEAIIETAHPSQKVALAAFAGLRAGEVRGLRWTDVDRKRGVITVRRSRVAGVDGTPKSGHGRVVPIAAPLLPHLEQARNRKKGPWDNVSLTRYGKP
jgi:integrase